MYEIFLGLARDISQEDLEQEVRRALEGTPYKNIGHVFLCSLAAEVDEPEIQGLPYQGKASIKLSSQNTSGVKLIPAEALVKADADFCLAELRCSVYVAGSCYVWTVQRVGPTDEELLKDVHSQISDEDVEVLDSLFRE